MGDGELALRTLRDQFMAGVERGDMKYVAEVLKCNVMSS
jgi:hypothetical protein